MEAPLGLGKVDDILGNPSPSSQSKHHDMLQEDAAGAAPARNHDLERAAQNAERSASDYSGSKRDGSDSEKQADARGKADKDLVDLMRAANDEGWHGLARRTAEMWHRRELPRGNELSDLVASNAPEAMTHQRGELDSAWFQHADEQVLYDEYRRALKYKGHPLAGPDATLPRAHPDDDGDEVARLMEGKTASDMGELRSEYLERSEDPENPDVHHGSMDAERDPELVSDPDDWMSPGGLGGGGGADDDDDDDDDDDVDDLLPDFSDGPVKDPKPRSAGAPMMGFDESAEVRGSLPDGVSMAQSGYGKRYRKR